MTFLQRYFASETNIALRPAFANVQSRFVKMANGALCQTLSCTLATAKAWCNIKQTYLLSNRTGEPALQSMQSQHQNAIDEVKTKIIKQGIFADKMSANAQRARTENRNTAKTAPAQQYYTALLDRRSHYDITNKLPLPKTEVTELIKKVVRQCPSSFNVQSSRIVILYGAEHQRVWDIVKAALKKVTTEDQYAASAQKVDNCFAAGAGTVLYFEDQDAVKQQQEQFPAYAANFPIWSQQHSGIVQFAVWTALAQEKIGATLQHYSELIEGDLRTAFDLPQSWKLIAQMPFGAFQNPAPEKTYIPDEKRFIVRGE